MDRRQFLAGLGASLGAASIGCGDNLAVGLVGGDAGPPDTAGNACREASGLPARQLLAGIDTIVVLCMENRSFDHVLGSLRLEGRTDIDGLTGAEWNPDNDGNPIAVHPIDDVTIADPPHNWEASHRQWNGGANNGSRSRRSGSAPSRQPRRRATTRWPTRSRPARHRRASTAAARPTRSCAASCAGASSSARCGSADACGES
jgi:phospholipase C